MQIISKVNFTKTQKFKNYIKKVKTIKGGEGGSKLVHNPCRPDRQSQYPTTVQGLKYRHRKSIYETLKAKIL